MHELVHSVTASYSAPHRAPHRASRSAPHGAHAAHPTAPHTAPHTVLAAHQHSGPTTLAGPPTPKLWDLTGFPEWVCLDKVGANAYSPVSRGFLAGASGGGAAGAAGGGGLEAAMLDEETQLQMALAASLAAP